LQKRNLGKIQKKTGDLSLIVVEKEVLNPTGAVRQLVGAANGGGRGGGVAASVGTVRSYTNDEFSKLAAAAPTP
jgi:hypothetical protein